MPRPLDIDARRLEVARAAMELLARGGSKALTIKAIAAELGGSTTLVTHIFSRKDEIYDAIAELFADDLDRRIPPLADAEPKVALRDFLVWCVPLEVNDLGEERLRFAFLERSAQDPRLQAIVDELDTRMRVALAERLRPLVSVELLDDYTDFFRAVTNGAILSVVEQPGLWSERRLLAVIDGALGALDGVSV